MSELYQEEIPFAVLKTGRIARIFVNTRFWILVGMLAVCTVLHYPQQILGIEAGSLFSFLGVTRYSVERILLLIPITYAGFVFGRIGGITCLLLSLMIMLPRLILITADPPNAIVEAATVIVLGVLGNGWLEIYRKQQKKLNEKIQTLEITRLELKQYVQAAVNSDKALSAINSVGMVASQSLDLQRMLEITAVRIRDVMNIDASLVFLLNEKKQELDLTAYCGVTQQFTDALKGIKVGEGFNGAVAQSGEPLIVADASRDHRLTRSVVKKEGIRSMLVVPLKSQDKVIGTLCVAGRYARQFHNEEVDLLNTIGSQVGIAIENSRLYESERLLAEQGKLMQERLRFYLGQVTRAQEEERKRIAQELHDDTIQELVLLLHKIDHFSSGAGFLPPEETLFLEELRQRISRISDEVRRFTQDLRPSVLDDLGLLPALEWLVADVKQHFGIKVDMSAVGAVHRFPQDTELELFRITQEALRNIWKHSEASQAHLQVQFNASSVIISIDDNGKGFVLPARVDELALFGKLGLVGMQERAQLIGAKLELTSESGKGTRVTIEMPYSA